jgi:ribosome-associated protein
VGRVTSAIGGGKCGTSQEITPTGDDLPVRDVPIREDVIRLGQFLKLAGLADSGSEAKALLADGEVTVNGEAEERRGRQLRRGDIVAVSAEAARVA